MKNKNKKLLNKKTALIAGISFFGLILPKIVFAYWWVPYGMKKVLGIFKSIGEATVNEFGEALLSVLINFIFRLLNWLVRAAASTFEAMLNVGFESHIDIVKRGWEITRDFSNMLFILFLVIIAFATILRLPRYGIKELLPKVIIIALLINFSLVICSVIIDFSNITANFFVNDIQKKINNKGGISGTLADSVKLSKTHFAFDCDDEGLSPEQEKECKELEKKQEGYDIFTMLIVLTIGSLVMLVFAFVLFAGAILLLIRIVIIWFLLMLVPLVFICYIMPGLRQNWQRWWKTFLQWCFFAPAYAFFIWLATMVAMEGKTENLASKYEPQLSGTSPLETVFTSTPATALVNYFFIIALLIGGLIAAQKFGIYGASTAMNIGQKWGKGAERWIGRKVSRRPADFAARTAGGATEKVGKALQRIPGLGRAGRGLEARGIMLRQKPLSTKEAERYKKRFALMSPENQAAEIASQKRGAYAVLGAQLALENGTLAKTKNTKAVQTSIAQLRVNGFTKQAEDLEEKRVDAIEDDARQDEAMKRAFKKGVHNEWDEQVLKGTQGQKVIQKSTNILGADQVAKWFEKIGDKIDEEGQETIINKLQSELKPEAFAKEFQKWAKKIQTKAEEVLRSGFTDNPTDTNNLKRRKQFGMATNTLRDAFLADNTGAINASYASKMKGAIEQHVWGLSGEDIGKLKTNADKILVAMHMKPNQVFDSGPKLTGRDKELMKNVAARNNLDAHKQMQKLDTWAT